MLMSCIDSTYIPGFMQSCPQVWVPDLQLTPSDLAEVGRGRLDLEVDSSTPRPSVLPLVAGGVVVPPPGAGGSGDRGESLKQSRVARYSLYCHGGPLSQVPGARDPKTANPV